MIRYRLLCDQDHAFDGWFRNAAAFDGQVEAGLVVCPHCASTQVSKALMTPALPRKGNQKKSRQPALPRQPDGKTQEDISMIMTQMRRHIEENCDYVGKEFPGEARRIHYGEAEQRNIYGEATLEEARELVEEGVEVAPVPLTPKPETH